MSFTSKKIQTLFVQTPLGELALSAKAAEEPEIKPFTGSIEDSDDGLTNDGQLIKNYMPTRSYIQGVFAYKDADIPYIESIIESAKVDENSDVPANAVMTDGSIYSNTGTFVGDIMYNGTGTMELKFVSAQKWIQS
jgi:hypothetical protein